MHRSRALIFLIFGSLSACSRITDAPPVAPRAGVITSPTRHAAAIGSTAATPSSMPIDSTPEPSSPARALRDTTLATSRAFDTVRSLVDAAGPRLAGSPGDRAAVAWALRTLPAYGLVNVRAEPVRVPHWERGEERGAITSPIPRPIALTALGGSIGTPTAGLEAEVVEVDSLDAIDRLPPDKVKGRIVFVNAVMERTRDETGYMRVVRSRSRGPSRAAKAGAAGFLIRSIGTGDARAPHTGGMRYEDGVPKIPAAALAIPDAELLHRLLAEGKPVRFKMTLGAKTFPDADSANVIGEVTGSAAPDEIILLAAHLDAWDLGHGAEDDGAGVAVILEAARQIALLPSKPRRTIRVALFANEENGLAGARAYARAHEPELAKHLLALEADSGSGRVFEARFLGAERARPLFLEIAALLRPLGVEPSSTRAEGGADLSPLVPLGVPVIDLMQDSTRYFDVHHTANDTLEHIHKDELDQVAAAFTAVAFAAADAKDDFGRAPTSK